MSESQLDPEILARISQHASIVSYRNQRPVHGHRLFMACGARLVGNVTCGNQVSIWFNAVVRGDVNSITIGDQTNIQDNAVIHGTYERYSTTIGSQVSIGHGATVHGAVIKDRVLIGMQAVIMDGASIGEGSVIGAGAVVRQGHDIPPYSLVVGAPATVKRTLTAAESDAYTAAYLRYLFYVSGFDYPDTRIPN
jgi:gamma-carbonic anhydrase